jgi:hypothetical protein
VGPPVLFRFFILDTLYAQNDGLDSEARIQALLCGCAAKCKFVRNCGVDKGASRSIVRPVVSLDGFT